MVNPDAIIKEPFNFKSVNERNGEFVLSILKLSFGQPDIDFTDEKTVHERLMTFVADSAKSLAEVDRLYKVLDGQKRRHLPMPGEPGAPVKCISCSLHGAEVLWPCEPYKTADAALPEGWPL